MKYLHGTIKEPKKFDLFYESWDAKNYMIISWLLNFTLPEIRKPCLYPLLNQRSLGCHLINLLKKKEILMGFMSGRLQFTTQ